MRLGHRSERAAILLDERPPKAQQRSPVGEVFQPRDRRLRAQLLARGQAIQRQLEPRIAAQRVGVVAVLVPGGDHQHAEPHDLRQAMHDPLRHPRVHQAVRQSVRQAQPTFDFAQRQQAIFRRQPAASGTGLYVAVQAFGALIGFLIGAYLADAIGRKWTFMISAIATIIMVLVYLYMPVGDTGLLLLGIPLNAAILMKFAPMGPFMTELYPTNIRGTGQGFCYNAGRAIGSVFMTAILVERGFPIAKSLNSIFWITLAFPCASAFMMYSLERFGRKPTAVTAFLLTALFGLLWANAGSEAMVLAIGFGMIFFIQLAGNSSQIFISEVFPTNARAFLSSAGLAAGEFTVYKKERQPPTHPI